jgi:hypothetical protein
MAETLPKPVNDATWVAVKTGKVCGRTNAMETGALPVGKGEALKGLNIPVLRLKPEMSLLLAAYRKVPV